jgi:hypothetical protein
MSTSTTPKIIPAQLSFLSIYNPTLGTTEETFQDQIVYYYSHEAHQNRKNQDEHDLTESQQLRDQENEKQRQIGLAQGMVDFARYVYSVFL